MPATNRSASARSVAAARELEDAIGAYFSGRYPIGEITSRPHAVRVIEDAAKRALALARSERRHA